MKQNKTKHLFSSSPPLFEMSYNTHSCFLWNDLQLAFCLPLYIETALVTITNDTEFAKSGNQISILSK